MASAGRVFRVAAWGWAALIGLASVAACTPRAPLTYPDADSVASAQKKWCAMMAELEGGDGPWRFQADCDAATPTGSAQFVERMTPCFKQLKQDYGDRAPDSGSMIDECTQQVLAGADPGDISQTELWRARCDRMVRCAKADASTCDGVIERLDGYTKALLTNMYNLEAQAKVAGCLAESACSDDEPSAEDACYLKVRGYRVWLPL
jgi:predicted small lipoprotein YifL